MRVICTDKTSKGVSAAFKGARYQTGFKLKTVNRGDILRRSALENKSLLIFCGKIKIYPSAVTIMRMHIFFFF